MKAKLIVEGKELEVDIPEQEVTKLLKSTPKKVTGYERAGDAEPYWNYDPTEDGAVFRSTEAYFDIDAILYGAADYYTDKQLAIDCVRADTLMRKLRRFSAEHRDTKIMPCGNYTNKWSVDIRMNSCGEVELVAHSWQIPHFGTIYFDTREHCKMAIDEFRDELIWYFTEYRDTAEVFD